MKNFSFFNCFNRTNSNFFRGFSKSFFKSYSSNKFFNNLNSQKSKIHFRNSLFSRTLFEMSNMSNFNKIMKSPLALSGLSELIYDKGCSDAGLLNNLSGDAITLQDCGLLCDGKST